MKKTFYGIWDTEHEDLVLIPDEQSYLRSMVADLETLKIFFDICDGTMVKLTVESLGTAQIPEAASTFSPEGSSP